jgi:hypothetical protein
MKQVFFFLFAAVALTACNDDKTATEDSKTDPKVASASDAKMDYAYTIEHPDQWEWGSKENTKMVLASLKAFEMNNIDESMKAFADTVQLRFDNFEAKLPKDSVKAMFVASRNSFKSNKIDMHDFESVKSKDGKEEYVSLWYVEKWEDMKGNWDSSSVMDDVKIKDGKIIELDQKLRKFPKKKM